MRSKKKQRVPEILWRLYRHRARTLAHTIVSLIPPLPPHLAAVGCVCKGRRCLQCSRRCGGDADTLAFLVRPDDPSDYRRLLNHCFIVVNDNAPSFTEFFPYSLWSQRQIVERTIEMTLCGQTMSSNVICTGYDKRNHTSPIVELLTSCAWELLLNRVGDNIMVYLLRHASIFLLLLHKKHHQVAGFPISDISYKMSKRTAESQNQCPSIFQSGPQKRRKTTDNNNSRLQSQQCDSSFNVDGPFSSTGCVGCSRRSCRRLFSRELENNRDRKNFSQATALNIDTGATKSESQFQGELQQSSSLARDKGRKRLRPFRWQRCRISSQKAFPECSGTTSFVDDNSLGRLENNCDQKNFSEVTSLNIDTGGTKSESDFKGELQQSSNQARDKGRKRLRPFSWQRRRTHGQKMFLECSGATSCVGDNSLGRLQYDFTSGSNHLHEKMPAQCSCCLRLQAQASRLVTPVAQIDMRSMCYNSESSLSVLPRKHILNCLKPNFAGAKSLIGKIFGLSDGDVSARSTPCSHSSGCCVIRSACLYHSLVKLLTLLIRRAQNCKHQRLLDKHCAVSSLDQKEKDLKSNVCRNSNFSVTKHCKEAQETGDPQSKAANHYCSKHQVVSFLWAVCRNIVPPDLLGTPRNWRILRSNIAKFVRLRRFESFSVRQCVHKLKISRFPLLSNKHCSCYLGAPALNYADGKTANRHKDFSKPNHSTHSLRDKLLVNWIYWFFSCLVVPLVQANFYVTESEHGKQEIFYYRKSSWENLRSRTITCLTDKNYCHLDDATVRNIISERKFGFSKVRLRPKKDGVRILANLKAPSRMPQKKLSFNNQCHGMGKNPQLSHKVVKFDHFKSVNSFLRDTHAVFKGLPLKEPDILGSSVFDYNDVYKRLCPFLIGLKNGAASMTGVFVVVSDVSKAFDSIDQDMLLSVMKDAMQHDKYLLEKSYEVVCTKKFLWVHENLISKDEDIRAVSPRFTSSVSYRTLHSVHVDKGGTMNVEKDELFFILNEHVKRNILQFDKKFYLQGIGIPQGSILSSLLSSFYYGHMERNMIYPYLERISKVVCEEATGNGEFCEASAAQGGRGSTVVSSPSYILLRFTDDFLFISTSKKLAAGFFSRLHTGFRDYNCNMNESKFGLNFDVEQNSRLPSNRVYVGDDGISFLPWSGLLINCCTLEVQADYTRYGSNHLSSTLTVSWQRKPVRHLQTKLCSFMRPKCHPLLFDSNINSASVVRLNIYQAFLLCAMKFHCYVRELSYICKLKPRLYLKMIEKSIRYMRVLIKKRMRAMRLSSDLHPVLKLGEGEVEWLGLNAYVEALKRKQSRHKELLSLLRSKLVAQKIGVNPSNELKYAVDRSHSSLMWNIKY